ncbi:MAG: ABC transporter ATP-binding protein [Acidimicrobiales bacterium]
MLAVRELDAFYGQAQALWAVDLDVGDAETVAVVGPNGAGKSTLVHAIAGLHRSRRGHIRFDGHEVTTLPEHAVCGLGIAIVPEGRRVFAHMTVYDNLCLGAYRRSARAGYRDALTEVYELFPRLSERSAQLAGSLSGGEQQMLAIGRAMMSRPQLLLMDEPSLGLAPVVIDEVFDAIESINARGVSVLLVEQDVERALELAGRGYLLTEGRVVTSGPSTQMRDNEDLRRSVLGL